MDSVPCTTLASTHANGVDKQPNSSNELTAPMAIHATNTLLQDFSRPLHLAAIQIIEQFTLRTEYLQRITDHFLVELSESYSVFVLPFSYYDNSIIVFLNTLCNFMLRKPILSQTSFIGDVLVLAV